MPRLKVIHVSKRGPRNLYDQQEIQLQTKLLEDFRRPVLVVGIL